MSEAAIFLRICSCHRNRATEYSDLILSIKIVDSLLAITHINSYGSGHTDAIITEDSTAAATFLAQVNAAGCTNCSTRFSDGFRYGFGAEVEVPNRCRRVVPGLEGLVTYKYQLTGDGHIAATTWQMLSLYPQRLRLKSLSPLCPCAAAMSRASASLKLQLNFYEFPCLDRQRYQLRVESRTVHRAIHPTTVTLVI